MPIKKRTAKLEIGCGRKKRIIELEPGTYHLGRVPERLNVLGIKDLEGRVLHSFDEFGEVSRLISREHLEIKVDEEGNVHVKDISSNGSMIKTGGDKPGKPINIDDLDTHHLKDKVEIILGIKGADLDELVEWERGGDIKRISLKKLKGEINNSN